MKFHTIKCDVCKKEILWSNEPNLDPVAFELLRIKIHLTQDVCMDCTKKELTKMFKEPYLSEMKKKISTKVNAPE